MCLLLCSPCQPAKQGTGTFAQYGDASCTGQTEIDVGTFQAASPFAIPGSGRLVRSAPGSWTSTATA